MITTLLELNNTYLYKFIKMDNNDKNYHSLCIYAFDVLILSLKNLDKGKLKFPDEFKGKEYPLFVTWSMGNSKALRGCIGTFSPDDVEKNLMLYSYIAAFKDTRFKPISDNEVPMLNVGVSLLIDFEDGSDAYDWEVGLHGITIQFTYQFVSHHATFLPEVASDRNWDKRTTLLNLVKKAGYYGDLDKIMEDIKLRRYKSVKAGISHDEYKVHKEKNGETEFIIC